MLKLNTLLHAMDFSGTAQEALRYACNLALDHEARLVSVYVEPPLIYTEMPMVFDSLDEGQYLDRIREAFRALTECDARFGAIPFEALIRQGDPATEIVRLALERNCDWIVMGSHGRTGIARLLMGSVSEQVLRTAHCPVLTVKSAREVAETEIEEEVAWISE